MTNMRKRIFALDFDGVLCDSAYETAHTAWRAGRKIWTEWREKHPPKSHVEGFRRLRPVLETGYQAIPLMRLVEQGVPEADVLANPEYYLEQAIGETACTRKQLQEIMGSARDEWMEKDFADWIAHHRFYPGVVDALVAARDNEDVYILTTKQERFLSVLLESVGVHMSADRIYGLEKHEPKEVTLCRILKEDPSTEKHLHFVEDRLPTLERTLDATEGMKQIRLHLADWGYNTADARVRAEQTRGIEVMFLEEFCEMLTTTSYASRG